MSLFIQAGNEMIDFSLRDILDIPRDEERILCPAQVAGFIMNIEGASAVMKGWYHLAGLRIGKFDVRGKAAENEELIGLICSRQIWAIR